MVKRYGIYIKTKDPAILYWTYAGQADTKELARHKAGKLKDDDTLVKIVDHRNRKGEMV